MTQLARGLGASLVVVVVIGVLALLGLAAYARVLRQRRVVRSVVIRRVAAAGLVLSLLAIALVTLLPTAGAGEGRVANLVPGRGLTRPWQAIAAGNVLGNVALFVPLGLLGPVRFTLLVRLPRLVAAAAALSLGIEATQYLFDLGRAADVNDVLFNVVGAIAGWLVVRLATARVSQPARVAAAPTPPSPSRRVMR
jgi:positive regulator of sigma E activity